MGWPDEEIRRSSLAIEAKTKQSPTGSPVCSKSWIMRCGSTPTRSRPGEHISTNITEGLKATDYFLLLVSGNSNQSRWVKREVSAAFRLSNEKKLAFIPVVLDDASVPLELEGVLYIKASREGLAGLTDVRDFFAAQNTTVSDLAGSGKTKPPSATSCEKSLGTLSLGALRLRLTTKLSLVDVGIIWFDLFSRKMEDETKVHDLPSPKRLTR
jgi:hypothetical protein